MGMFDNIVCHYPLPDGFDAASLEWQTKDTDAQWLDTYTITAEGRLVHTETDAEIVPEAERPFPNATDWRKACGSMRMVNPREVDTNYHGDLYFYGNNLSGSMGGVGYTTSDDKPWRGRGYVARFTNGTVQSITVVPEDCEPPTWGIHYKDRKQYGIDVRAAQKRYQEERAKPAGGSAN